jgi:predicted Fe-Mo cluster-binding NifX family protein
MRVAIPVKTEGENPAVSPLFGKAKWFAFVDDGKVTVEKNSFKSGLLVVDWLLEKEIDALVVQHIGESPYRYIEEAADIPIFFAGEGRVTLSEAMEKFDAEALTIIDDTNIDHFSNH